MGHDHRMRITLINKFGYQSHKNLQKILSLELFEQLDNENFFFFFNSLIFLIFLISFNDTRNILFNILFYIKYYIF